MHHRAHRYPSRRDRDPQTTPHAPAFFRGGNPLQVPDAPTPTFPNRDAREERRQLSVRPCIFQENDAPEVS